MASGYPGDAVRQINRLFQYGTVGALTDGQLLERFATRRGEASDLAFEALVSRHGPMVLRVARGLLRDPHDVDDAFQATFLVLVRRAASVGCAVRTSSTETRAAAVRSSSLETPASPSCSRASASDSRSTRPSRSAARRRRIRWCCSAMFASWK